MCWRATPKGLPNTRAFVLAAAMKLVVGRILSALVTATGWLLFGARIVLDAVGYSTAPEDLGVFTRRAVFILTAVPWWGYLVFALATTMWLMWVSWPRPGSQPAVATEALPTVLLPTRTLLRLTFRPGHDPEEIRSENVYRWYGLNHIFLGKNVSYSVFIVFERSIENRHSRVTADPPVNRMMINHQTDRSAIITIPGGPPPRLDLEMVFSSQTIPL